MPANPPQDPVAEWMKSKGWYQGKMGLLPVFCHAHLGYVLEEKAAHFYTSELEARKDALYRIKNYTDPSHQRMSPFARLSQADKQIAADIAAIDRMIAERKK